MRGKLDENIPTGAVAIVESVGWQCDTVYDEYLNGAVDPRVAEVCRVDNLVLFTIDLDFANIRAYPPADYEGIVVLRPVEPDRERILRLFEMAMPVLSVGWVPHRLWIVEPTRIRCRGTEE